MTNIQKVTNKVYQELDKHDSTCKIVSIEHLYELQQGIEGRHKKGELDEEFYQKELSWFVFKKPENFPEARSLIIVAAPQPQVQVTFTLDGATFPVLIPPTYSYVIDTQVQSWLEGVLQPEGYRILKVPSSPPLKLLAAHSGLMQYGKNNIGYVPGKGSFQRLMVFYSDLPRIEEQWGEPQSMDLCNTCQACSKACPTGAIAPDRFLLHGERCITFFNEFPGEFPDWLDPSWHNCLVGCLFCQTCCPMNNKVKNWVEEQVQFSQNETTLLLQGVSKEQLPEEMAEKLKQLGLIGYLPVLPRNLKALLELHK